VADATGTTVWRWDQAEPFGDSPANDDPDGNLVAFDLPLRLPGQYYDTETDLAYNDFRNYFPSLGRYLESDPAGIHAGVDTYIYVDGSPITFSDPFGLFTFALGARGSFFFGGAGGTVGGSVGFSSSGQLCAQIQTCGRLGAGTSIGVGGGVSLGTGQYCPGRNSLGFGAFGNIGAGPFGSLSTNTTSTGTTATIGIGGGVGFAAGVQTCITRAFCLRR